MSPPEDTSATGPYVPGDGLRTDSLAASVAILLVLTVVQRLVGFLRGVLFCRWLDAEQLGQWDMAFGFLMLAAPLVVLGLPGSFGRYVEYYRQRGQLRTFLRRAGAWTLVLAALGVVGVLAARGWFSELLFGSRRYGGLVTLLGAGLGVVILYNALTSLYTALRQVRLVSAMQFANSLLFAGLGVGLVLGWRSDTASVVLAFVVACAVTSMASLPWIGRIWRQVPPAAPLGRRSLWGKLLPFAFWLWLTNWLSNVFGIADRFLIIHYSGLAPVDALNMVGQYHTARMFPVLFMGVAELLAAVVTPHLSADWEAGRRDEVSRRLRLLVKVFGAALTAGSVAVLLCAPLLFNVVWQERYFDGWMVLPWALVCGVWASLAFVSYNYLWCAEKSRFVTLTLAVGLALNVGINLLVLPILGLLGAVLAAAAARLAALALLWWISRRLGMQADRGLWVVAALPLLLTVSPWLALAGLIVATSGAIPGVGCFDADERRQLLAKAADYWHRLRRLLRLPAGRPTAASGG